MPSFYLDQHGKAPVRVRKHMDQKTALSTFKDWVGHTALGNGLNVLSMTDSEATLGLKVTNSDKSEKPVVVAYLCIEPYSPPSRPEKNQPCRRAMKGA
jgi:hypothetical protein